MNEIENTTYQNLQAAVKAVFTGKCIAVDDCIFKKGYRYQISNLNFHLKKLGNEEQCNSKQQVMKIRAETD